MFWIELWGILQLHKIELVGSIPHVDFRLERFTAFLAVFPLTGMPFIAMEGT